MGGLLREGPYKRGTTAPTTSKATMFKEIVHIIQPPFSSSSCKECING